MKNLSAQKCSSQVFTMVKILEISKCLIIEEQLDMLCIYLRPYAFFKLMVILKLDVYSTWKEI